jgi:hypothetical protein
MSPMFKFVETTIFQQLYYKRDFFLSNPLFALCCFTFIASWKELYMGLPSFMQCNIFLQKKPKKTIMEIVVSKSHKDITFSTIGFLLRMPII